MPIGDDLLKFDKLVEFCAENKLDYNIHSSLEKETITTTMGGVTQKYTRYGYGSMFYKDKNGKIVEMKQ